MRVVAVDTCNLPNIMQRRTDNCAGVGALGRNLRLRTVMTFIADIVDYGAFTRSDTLVDRRIPPPKGITVAGATSHTTAVIMGGINDRGH